MAKKALLMATVAHESFCFCQESAVNLKVIYLPIVLQLIIMCEFIFVVHACTCTDIYYLATIT